MGDFIERHFRLLVAAPLLLLTVLQLSSASQESQTFDEGVHLAAGYRYWKTGNFSMGMEHPPLQKLLSGLPLLLLAPPLPRSPVLLADEWQYARVFLYRGPQSADRLLLFGRLPTIALTVLLAIAVGAFAYRYFGREAAVIGVWLCALDPNLIAHGRLVTTDMAAALLFFLSILTWVAWLDGPSRRRRLYAGIALGLALGAKCSMIILLPLLPTLLLLRWVVTRHSLRQAVDGLCALTLIVVISVGVVAVLYAPEVWRIFVERTANGRTVALEALEIPILRYGTALRTVFDHNRYGHEAFLLGELSKAGWWYYFPVVFAVKSTTAALVLTLLTIALAARAIRVQGSFIYLSLMIPPLVYFVVSMSANINLGIRHLLPIYPFLYLIAAGVLVHALSSRRGAVIAVLIVLVQAFESLAVYPEYLAFFNAPSGGRSAGARYLLDSNIDWGQDLKKLKKYIDQNQPGPICLKYFGTADPTYYGIRWKYLPKTWDSARREPTDCVGAISVTLLHDLYELKGSYEWLRRRKHFAVVGSSIYLYDLRQPER